MPGTTEEPVFPLRLIFDDGECQPVERPEDLLQEAVSIDSTDPRSGVWVRDALDRTILVRVRGGVVECLEVRPEEKRNSEFRIQNDE